MTDLQPRWPAHTPIAPDGHGPGGGRWMPSHASGGWAQRLADLAGLVRPGDWHYNPARRPQVLAQIARLHGFDAPPQVGSPAEVDDAVRGGGVELWRGVSGASASKVLRDFRTGSYVPGVGTGGHRYGEGYYFSTARDTGEGYAAQDGGTGGGLLRAALLPDAKVIDWEDLSDTTERLRHGSPVEGIDPALGWAMADPGILAAALGYDAIRVRGREDGVHMEAPFPDQYIVVNRRAVLAQAEAHAASGDWADEVGRRLRVPGNRPDLEPVSHGHQIRDYYSPGFWQQPTAAAQVEHFTGQPAEDVDHDLYLEAAAMARERTTYVNGHIAVHVHRERAGAPPPDVTQLLAVIDHLQSVAPIDRHLSIAVADPGVQYPSILGRGDLGGAIAEDGVAALSRGIFDPNRRLQLGWFIGAAHDAHPLTVITAHEWGHLLDMQWSELERRQAHEDHGGEALSRYAAGDPDGYESVAEAFVDWYLSRGSPDNPDTQWYADQLGWHWTDWS